MGPNQELALAGQVHANGCPKNGAELLSAMRDQNGSRPAAPGATLERVVVDADNTGARHRDLELVAAIASERPQPKSPQGSRNAGKQGRDSLRCWGRC